MNQTRPSQTLLLKVGLLKPPQNHAFCLQRGKGSKAERLDYVEVLEEGQPSVTFELTVEARPSKHGIGPDFFGPFIQGPTEKRFFYICVGTVAQRTDPNWIGRVKVPLVGIDWSMVDSASKLRTCLYATFQASRPDGSPTLASVMLVDAGWQVLSHRNTSSGRNF